MPLWMFAATLQETSLNWDHITHNGSSHGIGQDGIKWGYLLILGEAQYVEKNT